MDGFVFDFDESFPSESRPFAIGIERLSLTPKGIKLLAQCGHLPHLSEEEVAGKNKIDEIGKVLACIQAGWMVVQVCARLGLGLPVTLLEVSAVAHVLCALILYGLWWHKPRKIGEPTMLKGDWTGPQAAFMMMSSQVGQEQMLPGFRVEGETSEIASLKFIAESEDAAAAHEKNVLEPEENHHTSWIFRVRAKSGLPQLKDPDPEHELLEEEEDDQKKLTRTRWLLACRAVQRYPAVRRILRRPFTEANRKYEIALATYPEMPEKCRQVSHEENITGPVDPWWECSSQHLVGAVASNWPHDGS